VYIRDSFTGAAGPADGGDVTTDSGLLDLFSGKCVHVTPLHFLTRCIPGNAGDGGISGSGDAADNMLQDTSPTPVFDGSTSQNNGVGEPGQGDDSGASGPLAHATAAAPDDPAPTPAGGASAPPGGDGDSSGNGDVENGDLGNNSDNGVDGGIDGDNRDNGDNNGNGDADDTGNANDTGDFNADNDGNGTDGDGSGDNQASSGSDDMDSGAGTDATESPPPDIEDSGADEAPPSSDSDSSSPDDINGDAPDSSAPTTDSDPADASNPPLDPTPDNSQSSATPGSGSSQVIASNAYSGAAAAAQGGDVSGDDCYSLLNLFSNNAGDGGSSLSGSASSTSQAGSMVAGGAYSGAGGSASGGSVKGACGMLNMFSNNAGDGGMSSSGFAGV
jgi:hypothetical protein